MSETVEVSKLWQTTPWFTPDLAGDSQNVFNNFWKVEILLESKEKRNHAPNTDESGWVVGLRKTYLKVFYVLETVFLKLQEFKNNFLEGHLRKTERVSKETQIFLNHVLVYTFVLRLNFSCNSLIQQTLSFNRTSFNKCKGKKQRSF